MRCSCTFCLTGKPRMCVWRDVQHIVIIYTDTPKEPKWKVGVDWTLCIVFATVLVLARLLAP